LPQDDYKSISLRFAYVFLVKRRVSLAPPASEGGLQGEACLLLSRARKKFLVEGIRPRQPDQWQYRSSPVTFHLRSALGQERRLLRGLLAPRARPKPHSLSASQNIPQLRHLYGALQSLQTWRLSQR